MSDLWAYIVLIALPGWLVGMVLGWATTRDVGPHRPFNWRVFVGPWCYVPWVERHQCHWWT